uniref:C2H2-type domain-containing protein n=1 Tax=Rhodosorus marinus TaxID=101924 RepID=A0A7S2ZNP8_9RHOD|mmetsp:Transcript_26476/g.103119  ORF Transcript_26476/g.103119 Transcript_26476/m.103119 type:complete len:395 (+) Transcript_26476:294-1478(+)
MIIEGLEYGEGYELMREMLNDVAVGEWLLGGSSNDSFKLPSPSHVVPFDFMKVEPGPQAGVRETLFFRKSLNVLSHQKGNVAFGNMLKFEDSRMLNDRLIFAINEERTTSVCLIAVQMEDGGVMLRASVSFRREAFNRVGVLVGYARSGSDVFRIQQRLIIDRDCSFCMVRGEACDCDSRLKERDRLIQASLPIELSDAWHAGIAAIENRRGPAWVIFPDKSRMRAYTLSSSDAVTPRVQHMMSRFDIWKTLPVNEKDDKSLSSITTTTSGENDFSPTSEVKQQTHATAGHRAIVDRRKRFDCKICGSAFRSQSHLNRHLSGVHFREKKHACDLCGTKFGQRSHLVAHTKNVHTKQDNLECKQCGVKFVWRTNYFRHMRNQHGLAAVDVEAGLP